MGSSHHRAGLVFIGICVAIGFALFVIDSGRGWFSVLPQPTPTVTVTATPIPTPTSTPTMASSEGSPGYDGASERLHYVDDDEARTMPDRPPAPMTASTAGTPADDARRFAETYFAEGGAGADEAIPWLGQHYAETVDFFGKSTSRSAILQQKVAFVRRWPERSYRVEPGTIRVDCQAGQSVCRTSGIVDWNAASAERDARASGRASFTLIVADLGGASQIISEDSHVIELDVGSR
jgi:hypothetical protein